LDFGFFSIVSIISVHESGSDFKFLVPGAFKNAQSADMFQLMVGIDSDINEPTDIRGKRGIEHIQQYNGACPKGMSRE
jgi:hypothetical protein